MADSDGIGSTEWTVGCQLSLTTTLGEDIEGEIFAFDKSTNCIILKQAGSAPYLSNLRILKANYIKVFTASKPVEQPDLRLPAIDLQRCQEREDKAIQAAEAELAKVGVGVTVEGQQVFDALSKTMPCRWDGKIIAVLEEVFIKEPYRIEDCTAKNPACSSALNRVKKVLEAERRRLGHD